MCLVLTDLLLACSQLQGRKGQGAQRPRGRPGHNVYPGSVPRSQARGIKRWAAVASMYMLLSGTVCCHHAIAGALPA